MSESPHPRGGGGSGGEVRRLCGREYSWSVQRCSINLINGLITASKQSSEIRSRKEEEGCGRRTKAAHGQSGTVALLSLENTNQTWSSFFLLGFKRPCSLGSFNHATTSVGMLYKTVLCRAFIFTCIIFLCFLHFLWTP